MFCEVRLFFKNAELDADIFFEIFEYWTQLSGFFLKRLEILIEVSFFFAELNFDVFEFLDIESFKLLELMPEMPVNKPFVHFTGLDLEFSRI